jgi:hypothetical protein
MASCSLLGRTLFFSRAMSQALVFLTFCLFTSHPLHARAQKPTRNDIAYFTQTEQTLRAAGNGLIQDQSTKLNASSATSVYISPQRLGPQTNGDGAIADQLGYALAWDGTTLLIGARGDVITHPTQRLGIESGTVDVYTWNGERFIAQTRWSAPDAGETDQFGAVLALSGDWAVVGAPTAARDDQLRQGRAYVYHRSAGIWALSAELSAPSGFAEDFFGVSVAIDSTSRSIAIGASGRDTAAGNAVGAVFIYRELGGIWTLANTVFASNGSAEDRFGSSVALENGQLVVAAPMADVGGTNRGRIYLFADLGMGYIQTDAQTPSTVSDHAQYGSRLLIKSNSLFVGAPRDQALGVTQGRVYIHETLGNVLATPQLLTADDGQPDDLFGSSLAFDNQRILVGAPGRVFGEGGAYLFTATAGIYTQTSRLEFFTGPPTGLAASDVALFDNIALLGAGSMLVPPNRAQGLVRVFQRNTSSPSDWTLIDDLHRGDGAAFELSGFSIAIDNDTAAVGSYLDDTIAAGDDAGSVSIFRRTPSGWIRETKLTAPDGLSEDRFGISVALSGNVLAVGAYWRVESGRLNQGAVYLYERRDGTWTFVRRLVAFDGQADNYFGFSLALNNNRLVVGAPGNGEIAPDGGGAYVYTRLPDGTWQLNEKLRPTGVSGNALAGISVAIEGDLIAVGAPQDTVNTNSSQGRVYLYRLIDNLWTLQPPLFITDGQANDFFGSSISLAQGKLLVGALGATAATTARAGQAYLLTQNPSSGNFILQRRLQSPAPQAGAAFGASVSLQQSQAIIGASSEDADGMVDRGRVYVFTSLETPQESLSILNPTEATPYTYFGRSIARTFASLLIGGPERMGDNPGEGSAWAFTSIDELFRNGFE